MRDLDWYLTRAIERSGAKSDRKLSELLGLKTNAVNFYRQRGTLPTDETMLRLAHIAGIDPFIALTDLNTWRTTGAAQEAYKAILKKITAAVIIAGLVGLFVLIPDRAQAHTLNALTFAPLGSGLIDYSQKMTEAAMQMAEKKVWAHLS